MSKSQIYQHFNPDLEIYFTSKDVKFLFLGTKTDENKHTSHTIRNAVNGKTMSVTHSVLSQIVDFDSKPILIKK